MTPLPVDDDAIARYLEAIDPASDLSLSQLLDFYAGHDPHDVTVLDPGDEDGNGAYVRANTPTYHPDDLLRALITELRRERGVLGAVRCHLAEMQRRVHLGFKVTASDVSRAVAAAGVEAGA